MIKVKITTSTPGWRLIRQTPGSCGIWGNCQFYIDREDINEADWWIINGGLTKNEKTICPEENVVLIAGEPESIRGYDQNFLDQFPTVITSQRAVKHRHVIRSQTGLPWFINYHGNCYDEMKAVKSFQKEKSMSVIASIKSLREGQRKRLELIDSLKKHFGDKIDVFGGGINNVHDKWDGIAPYKYHIAIENGSFDDYWSEKLADAYLGGAYPFYYGCTNLTKYFPADSFTYIDVNDHKKTIEIIEHAIANNYYEQRIAKIFEARNLVLDKYNLFAMLTSLCAKPNDKTERKEVYLFPEKKRLSPRIEKLRKVPFLYKGLRVIYRKYIKDKFNADGRLSFSKSRMNIKNHKIKALGIILAPGESQSIPKKNIYPCDGNPLLYYTAMPAQKVKMAHLLDRVIIVTDDLEIANVAKIYSVEVPFILPKELTTNQTNDIQVIEYALQELEKKDGYGPDIIVYLRPSNPLKATSDIKKAVELLVQNPDAHSVRSNGYVDAVRRSTITKLRSLVGTDIAPFQFEKWRQVNINSMKELLEAEIIIKERRARGKEPWQD